MTERYDTFKKVLADVCPAEIAQKAAEVAAKYYPDNTLLGASEEEIKVVKQAQKCLKAAKKSVEDDD